MLTEWQKRMIRSLNESDTDYEALPYAVCDAITTAHQAKLISKTLKEYGFTGSEVMLSNKATLSNNVVKIDAKVNGKSKTIVISVRVV